MNPGLLAPRPAVQTKGWEAGALRAPDPMQNADVGAPGVAYIPAAKSALATSPARCFYMVLQVPPCHGDKFPSAFP